MRSDPPRGLSAHAAMLVIEPACDGRDRRLARCLAHVLVRRQHQQTAHGARASRHAAVIVAGLRDHALQQRHRLRPDARQRLPVLARQGHDRVRRTAIRPPVQGIQRAQRGIPHLLESVAQRPDQRLGRLFGAGASQRGRGHRAHRLVGVFAQRGDQRLGRSLAEAAQSKRRRDPHNRVRILQHQPLQQRHLLGVPQQPQTDGRSCTYLSASVLARCGQRLRARDATPGHSARRGQPDRLGHVRHRRRQRCRRAGVRLLVRPGRDAAQRARSGLSDSVQRVVETRRQRVDRRHGGQRAQRDGRVLARVPIVFYQRPAQRRDRHSAQRRRLIHAAESNQRQRGVCAVRRQGLQSPQRVSRFRAHPAIDVVQQRHDVAHGINRPRARQGFQRGPPRHVLGGCKLQQQHGLLRLARAVKLLQLGLEHPASVAGVRHVSAHAHRRPAQHRQRVRCGPADCRCGVSKRADQGIDRVGILAVAEPARRLRTNLGIGRAQLVDQEPALTQLRIRQRRGGRQPHLLVLVVGRGNDQHRSRVRVAQLAQRYRRFDPNLLAGIVQQRAQMRQHRPRRILCTPAQASGDFPQNRPRDVQQARLHRLHRGLAADLDQGSPGAHPPLDATRIRARLRHHARQQRHGMRAQRRQRGPVFAGQRDHGLGHLILGHPAQLGQYVQRHLPHRPRPVAQRLDQRLLSRLCPVRAQRTRRRRSHGRARVRIQRGDQRRGAALRVHQPAQRHRGLDAHRHCRIVGKLSRHRLGHLDLARRRQSDARRLTACLLGVIEPAHQRLGAVRAAARQRQRRRSSHAEDRVAQRRGQARYRVRCRLGCRLARRRLADPADRLRHRRPHNLVFVAQRHAQGCRAYLGRQPAQRRRRRRPLVRRVLRQRARQPWARHVAERRGRGHRTQRDVLQRPVCPGVRSHAQRGQGLCGLGADKAVGVV